MMAKANFFISIWIFLLYQLVVAQEKKTDANIIGHVTSNGEHISFASISIKGTTIGTTTNETGHYQLINLPTGDLTLVAQFLGFKPQEKKVTINFNDTKEVLFELEPDLLGLDAVVISGDRTKVKRKEASTIVNVINPKIFENTQSLTLSEGLNFCSGVRTENNCQNCGFTQVRMNGLEGPYSQILINSRPIFSGLAAVYGLEIIPSNMIEKVEIIRGGGSALYGGNAIAGTINLILKEPTTNTYEFGLNGAAIGAGTNGEIAEDFTANFNTSMVSANNKSAMSLYGFHRNRNPYDANNDSFSEIALLKNTTLGTRLYHRIGNKAKITGDFFTMKEERRGGNKFEEAPHQTDIAEWLEHNITTGALTYEQYFREQDELSVYASGQHVNRDSYYGAEKALDAYGKTTDFTYTIGSQYSAKLKKSTIIIGAEHVASDLMDLKLGYPDYENSPDLNNIVHVPNTPIRDQIINTSGVFAQYEKTFSKLKIAAGLRYDRYIIGDNDSNAKDLIGNVLNPRVNLKYDVKDYLQARVSYSKGYRAPQIFNEDLHIESSGARRVISVNSDDLEQETSQSYMASLDFNKKIGATNLGILLEGFYTQLDNPFVSDFGMPDANGEVLYTRINAEDGAAVKGVNIEINVIPSSSLAFSGGFTIQNSEYDGGQEFNEVKFFRTPEQYGYFTIDWNLSKKIDLSTSGTYTGKMLVPFFGLQSNTIGYDPNEGELRTTDSFFDLGLKAQYKIDLNGTTLQLYSGLKNIFNAYQNDFETGINRDPGYVYGPINPRTIYIGLKFGNFI